MHRYRQAATRESNSDEFQQRSSTSLVRTPQSSSTPPYDPIKLTLSARTNARFLSKQRATTTSSYEHQTWPSIDSYGQTSPTYGQAAAATLPAELPTAPPGLQGLQNQTPALEGPPPITPNFSTALDVPMVSRPPVSTIAPYYYLQHIYPQGTATRQTTQPLTQLPDYVRSIAPPIDPSYTPAGRTNLGNVISILPGEAGRPPSPLSAHAMPLSDRRPDTPPALPRRLSAPTIPSRSGHMVDLPELAGPKQSASVSAISKPLTSKTSDIETAAIKSELSELPKGSKAEARPGYPKPKDPKAGRGSLESSSSTSTTDTFYNEKIVITAEGAASDPQETSSLPDIEPADLAPFVDYWNTVRPRPRFTFPDFLQNLFKSTAKSSVLDNDPVRKEAAKALRNADQAFQMLKQFRSKSIVAEFALRDDVTRDAQITVKSTSNHHEFQAIALCPLTQGIRIIYVIDDDVLAESAISHFFRKASDRNWQRFRTWSSRRRIVRTALQPLSRWMPMAGSSEPMQFAFGLEHPEPLSTMQHNEASSLLNVVASAKLHEVYEKSLFNTVPETPRYMFYFSHEIISGPQVIIIVQNQPFHCQSSEADMKTMNDEEIWTDLLTQRPNPVPAGYMYMVVFDLLKDLLTHIMVETVECWNSRMRLLEEQLNELERRVYSQPSDDTPSSDLWNLSKHLLTIQQMIGHHAGTMQWAQNTLNTYAMRLSAWDDHDRRSQWDEASQHEWLREYVAEMTFIAENVERNLKEPIEKMLDLMYKSVSIRDSRLSLELNASLWRLSWITFVFLPLTFLVGFFGMNVDVFGSDPSVKWYFISAAPFMTSVFLAWFALKHGFSVYLQTKTTRARMSQKNRS